jgi:hypothetical protein
MAKNIHTLVVNGRYSHLRVKRAQTFFTRLMGWMFRDERNDHEALLITPCNAIHTIGMRFMIDVIFLNEKSEVIRIVHNLPPFRTSKVPKATHCIELRANAARDLQLRLGDIVTLGN